MAYKITDECIRCSECEWACENDAVSRGEMTYVIDPNRCTECVNIFKPPQCVVVCPVNCIIHDPDHKETLEQRLIREMASYELQVQKAQKQGEVQ